MLTLKRPDSDTGPSGNYTENRGSHDRKEMHKQKYSPNASTLDREKPRQTAIQAVSCEILIMMKF
jgi:hypothetical protein